MIFSFITRKKNNGFDDEDRTKVKKVKYASNTRNGEFDENSSQFKELTIVSIYNSWLKLF